MSRFAMAVAGTVIGAVAASFCLAAAGAMVGAAAAIVFGWDPGACATFGAILGGLVGAAGGAVGGGIQGATGRPAKRAAAATILAVTLGVSLVLGGWINAMARCFILPLVAIGTTASWVIGAAVSRRVIRCPSPEVNLSKEGGMLPGESEA